MMALACMSESHSIYIETGRDGSCPRDAAGVHYEGNYIILMPGYRRTPGIDEEQPGKGSRLYTRLINPDDAPQCITIVADWETLERVRHHDIGYLRHESESSWRLVPGRHDHARVRYELRLLPGATEFGLFPAYNVGRCRRFVSDLESRGVTVTVAGHSEEQREIWRISMPSTNPEARPLLLQARDHAYETAGSYAVEGITAFLQSDDAMCQYIRDHFDITILPMTNPDGVHNGMSRLTHENGANLERVYTTPDAAHRTLRSEIDRVRPVAHMNLHNWAFKFMDGILASNDALIDRIVQHMPADHVHHKRWHTLSTNDWLKREGLTVYPDALKSWRQYVAEQFAGYAVVFEFPWFGLTEDDMRRKGARAFVAFGLAVMEQIETG